MKFALIFLWSLFLAGPFAGANDLGMLTESNLVETLGWSDSHLAKDFPPLEDILKLYTYHRDPLKEDRIVSPDGWKFLGAYFDSPVVEAQSVRFNVLLNQTHLSHDDSTFVIERRSQVFQMVLGASTEGQKTAHLFRCENPRTFSTIYFKRPMTRDQLKDFIPNPIVALGRVMRIGFGNIRHDPFGHFDQLMGIFNKVEGVDTRLSPSEVEMVKNYTDIYKTFDRQFVPGAKYVNPCEQGGGLLLPVTAEETLIF